MTKLTAEYNKELNTFNEAMQYKLHANRHKGRWEDQNIDSLFDLLLKEIEELREEIKSTNRNKVAILLESADVGVFAMMIANVAMRIAVDGEVGNSITTICDAASAIGNLSKNQSCVMNGKPLGNGMFAGETHSKLVHPFNLPYERNNDNA
jgi:NTP pyrophosphatase (non-canonical NTP hydrolase)